MRFSIMNRPLPKLLQSGWAGLRQSLVANRERPQPQHRKTLLVEAMEQRLLLSAEPLVSLATLSEKLDTSRITGVTVVTHGFQLSGAAGDGLMGLGKAIVNFERANDGQSGDWAWILDYDIPSEGGNAGFDFGSGQTSSDLPGFSASETRSGELVLLFDWAYESNEVIQGAGWTEAAGDALFSMLAGLGLVNPKDPTASKKLHFIAHSFGSAVTSEAVERLAHFGIPVDQVTLLDPHDFNQGLGVDGRMAQSSLNQPAGYGATKWNNVSFMDVYLQTRGANSSAIPDVVVPLGRPIPGAFNMLLDDELPSVSGYALKDSSGRPHFCMGAVLRLYDSWCLLLRERQLPRDHRHRYRRLTW